jgi:hypothetical protein
MLKDNDTVIHLVILVTFVSFGVLFYSLGMTGVEKQTLILEEVRQVGDRLDTLNERVMTADGVSGDGEGMREDTQAEERTQPERYSFGGYTFTLPSGWSAVAESEGDLADSVEFSKSGMTAATMVCPPPGRGYEAWDFAYTTQTLEKDGESVDVRLAIGESDDVNDLYWISFDRGGDGPTRCSMVSDSDFAGDMDALEQDFRDIFSTTELE